jgi:hypothetical protein
MTEEELKAEAIRRGYEGAIVLSLGGAGHVLVKPSSEWTDISVNNIRSCNNCLIYNNGRWAPIITPSNQTEKQLPIFN